MLNRAIEVAEISETKVTEKMFPVSQPIKEPFYEKRKLSRLAFLPVMWLITFQVMVKKVIRKLLGKPAPKINSFWFDGLGSSSRKVKENAASWRALDEIYNYNFDRPIILGNLVDNFWAGMMNCQAVRNRFKLVKREIRRAILQFSNQGEVRLISLACGSAQAVLEVMSELKNQGVAVRAILIDFDQSALDYVERLASRYGVQDYETIKAKASQIVKISRGFQPQIVEMVGFLDYLPQEKAIRLVTKIREVLANNGVFIVSNIAPNAEMYFLYWVVNWALIYRTAKDLTEVVEKAGFSNYRLIYEPLKIHGVVVAKKLV